MPGSHPSRIIPIEWRAAPSPHRDRSPRGSTALVGTVIFLAFVQHVSLGAAVKHIGRIQNEVSRRASGSVDCIERAPG